MIPVAAVEAAHTPGFGYTHNGGIQSFCEREDCDWRGQVDPDDEVAEFEAHVAEAPK